MRFSVVIPAHNAADRIAMILQSVQEQTFKDYELIVICDACTDNTEEIAKQYGAITKCINAHSDGDARNAGLEMAQGEYILFADDDDKWLHECAFAEIDKKLKELIDIDVLCFSFIWKNRGHMCPRDNYGRGYWTAVWNKCWRKEFVKAVKFPNTPRYSDVSFTNQVFAKEPKIYEWDRALYYYNFKQKVKNNDT